jgi:hypothetical protein
MCGPNQQLQPTAGSGPFGWIARPAPCPPRLSYSVRLETVEADSMWVSGRSHPNASHL